MIDVLFRDIWSDGETSRTPLTKTLKFVYVDYTDDPNLKPPRFPEYTPSVSFLHSAPIEAWYRIPRVLIPARDGGEKQQETTFREYMAHNLKNRLALDGVGAGDATHYIGFAPIVAGASYNGWIAKVNFELIVFVGREGEEPSFSKSFGCRRDDHIGAKLRIYAQTLESCIENAVNKGLSAKNVARFIDAL